MTTWYVVIFSDGRDEIWKRTKKEAELYANLAHACYQHGVFPFRKIYTIPKLLTKIIEWKEGKS